VFEPLHPAASKTGFRYAFRALAPEDEHPELLRFLELVSAGRRCRMWTRYRGLPVLLFPRPRKLAAPGALRVLYRRWRKFAQDWPELAVAARRPEPLVKCIRANLMLGWLKRQMACRTVLMIRHPGAVVESQFRLGSGSIWDPEPVLERYRNDALLREWTGGRYRSLLERPLSKLEALAANWVIENQYALEHAASCDVTVVFYEQLKAAPEHEWQRMCQALELPRGPAAAVLSRPSQQSSTSSIDKPGDPRWLRGLSSAQIHMIQSILDETDCRFYSMSDPMPRSAAVATGRQPSVGVGRE
jgi:hypothetical protein